jgi:hypothetical protein
MPKREKDIAGPTRMVGFTVKIFGSNFKIRISYSYDLNL